MLKLLNKSTVTAAQTIDETTSRVIPHIRIISGALDESDASPTSIILNGRIDNGTLRFLKVDAAYQRPLGERADIFNAMKDGAVVPNIDIGVRGQSFEMDGADYIIKSDCYIIDGWQRIGNAMRLLELVPDCPVRIFATLRFGTDQIWERHRFVELNKNIKRVSPNLHLRNMRDQNEAVLTLYGLSKNTKDFPLYGKVCWSQNVQRGELITALVLAKTAAYLHSHKVGAQASSVEKNSAAILRISEAISLTRFRQNVHAFFSVIDDCWPIGEIAHNKAATQLKSTFLFTLARIFSHHPAFWDSRDNTLIVTAEDRRKLAKFRISDPQIMNLAGTGGAARNILYRLIVDHMNSGRRQNRLRSRFEDSHD